MRLLVTLVSLAVIAACSSDAESPDPSKVDWDNYSTDARERIDSARESGDCDELTRFFDAARQADIKTYIERSMRQAECYG